MAPRYGNSRNGRRPIHMAKKKDEVSDIDMLMDIALASSDAADARSLYTAADHMKFQTGIPLPHFCLRWLLSSNVWPLQRVTSTGGLPKSQKSAFIFQLSRWVLDAGGAVRYIETENKASPTLIRSMVGDEYYGMGASDTKRTRFRMQTAHSVNEWQQHITEVRNWVDKVEETNKRKFQGVMLLVVDSLLGSSTAETQEHISEKGEAIGRGYGDAPLLISQYLGSIPDWLHGRPIMLHLNHQEKPNIDGPGNRRAGGFAPDFYSTVDIQLREGGETMWGKGIHIDRADFKGKNITIKLRRSSMGPETGKEFVVPFTWHYRERDPETNNPVQRSQWEWDVAGASLLATRLRNEISPVMDIEFVAKPRIGYVIWSKTAGVSAADALPAAQFMRLLETEKRDLLAEVERTCGIYSYRAYAPGVLG